MGTIQPAPQGKVKPPQVEGRNNMTLMSLDVSAAMNTKAIVHTCCFEGYAWFVTEKQGCLNVQRPKSDPVFPL